MSFQTEFPFELPKGYLDKNGDIHKKGTMRLATAADEIVPMKDVRVQQNPSYLSIILLSRVITKLGDLNSVDVRVIENMFTTDLAYIQDLYQRINKIDPPQYKFSCSSCGHTQAVTLDFLGEE